MTVVPTMYSFHWLLGLLYIFSVKLFSQTVASADQQIDIDILCELPVLGPSGYMSEDGLMFHWNLCPKNKIKLSDLNPECTNSKGGENVNDGVGDVCITKVIYMKDVYVHVDYLFINSKLLRRHLYLFIKLGESNK